MVSPRQLNFKNKSQNSKMGGKLPMLAETRRNKTIAKQFVLSSSYSYLPTPSLQLVKVDMTF